MKCCLCGQSIDRGISQDHLKKLTTPYFGNSSQPLVPRFFDDIQFFSFLGLYGRCCAICDKEKVVPARTSFPMIRECLFVLTEESWHCTCCGNTIGKAQRPEKCPSCTSTIVSFIDSKTRKPI